MELIMEGRPRGVVGGFLVYSLPEIYSIMLYNDSSDDIKLISLCLFNYILWAMWGTELINQDYAFFTSCFKDTSNLGTLWAKAYQDDCQ